MTSTRNDTDKTCITAPAQSCAGRKAALVAAALFTVALVFSGCGNDAKEAELAKERERALQNFSEGVTPPPKPMPLPANLEILVPDSVKAKYKSVVMAVGVRKTGDVKKFTVRIGDTASVPGTDYTVKVIAYLPAWMLKGNMVTTKNDQQTDPAVRATIYESGKVVFDGFIFEKHKTPSFLTDTHAIGLVGADSK